MAHHPCNVDSSDSQFISASPNEEWHRSLRRLHSLIDYIVKNNSQRNLTAETKDYALDQDQLNLAVRVAHQIFSPNQNSASLSSGPPSSKRKKLISGVQELIEKFKHTGSEGIPWIQIMSNFLLEHPTFAQLCEIKEIVQHIIVVTSGCREYELINHAFVMFRVCCLVMDQRGQIEQLRNFLTTEDTYKLWDSVCNCLIAHQCQKESFMVTATLLHYRLFPAMAVDNILRVLLKQTVCDQYSMICLAALLENYQLPGYLTVHHNAQAPDNQLLRNLISDDLERANSTRCLLIEWLLPLEHAVAEFSSDVHLHYWLLVALVMRQTSMVKMDVTSYLRVNKTPTEFEEHCKNLESFFNSVELLHNDAASSGNPAAPNLPLNCYVPRMLQKLFSRINEICIQSSEQLTCNQQITSNQIPLISKCIHLLSLVRHLTSSDFLPNCDESVKDRVVQMLNETLNLLFDGLVHSEAVSSKRCIQKLVETFRTEIGARDDFLRRRAWDASWPQLDRLLAPSRSTAEDAIGSIRRASTSYPKPTDGVQIRRITASHDSLFDATDLNDTEVVLVDFCHYLTVLCCPTDEQEASRSCYRSMKLELVLKMTEVSLREPQRLSNVQIMFHVLRSYTASPVDAVDDQLIAKLLELSTTLCQHFGHDYEAAVCVLEIFPRLCLHIGAVGSDYTKSSFISLLQRFFSVIQEDLVGPPVEKAFYQCLAKLWTADPSSHWLFWQRDDHIRQDKRSVGMETLNGLTRPLNSTAVFTSNVIHQLFQNDVMVADTLRNFHWQEDVFDSLAALVMKDLSQFEERDRHIRCVAMLAALSSVVYSSPWMERKALVTMFHFCHVQQVTSLHLKRSLQWVAARLSIDYISFVESRLSYLLDQWLAEGNELEDFPYLVFCESRQEFLKKYREYLLPILFIRRGIQTFIQCCQTIDADPSDEIVNCFAQMLAVILPPFTLSKLGQSLDSSQKSTQSAVDKMKELEQALGSETVRTLIQEKLGPLIYHLLLNVWDSRETNRLFGFDTYLPQIGSYVYEKRAIITSIRHLSPDLRIDLADSQMEPYQSFLSLATNKPWDLHCLLVDIFSNLDKSCRFCDKQQTLVNISVLVEVISTSFQQENVPVGEYVFHFLVFRLCHLIRNPELDPVLRLGALSVFRSLMECSMKNRIPLVVKMLPIIVGNLTPVAKVVGILQRQALDILNLLIVKHQQDLKEAIPQLSPFPKLPEFQELGDVHQRLKQLQPSATLEQEINQFLHLTEVLGENVPVESLEYLVKLLQEHKQDLGTLYQTIADGSGSSSDCRTLHRLICRLILLARNKPPVVQVIACALGELGPSDLTTLVLEADVSEENATPLGAMKAYAKGHAVLELVLDALPLLVRYLSSERIQLVRQSGSVLRQCLDTYEGHQFVALTKKFAWPALHLLMPFKSSEKSPAKAVLEFNKELFDELVDDPDLWLPSNRSHFSWLSKLITTLLKCFNQSKGLLSFIEPICLVEPEFSQIMLPHVIKLILIHGNPQQEIRNTLSKHVNSLLAAHCSDSGSVTAQAVLKTLLLVVDYLRHQDRPKTAQRDDSTSWKNNFWYFGFCFLI